MNPEECEAKENESSDACVSTKICRHKWLNKNCTPNIEQSDYLNKYDLIHQSGAFLKAKCHKLKNSTLSNIKKSNDDSEVDASEDQMVHMMNECTNENSDETNKSSNPNNTNSDIGKLESEELIYVEDFFLENKETETPLYLSVDQEYENSTLLESTLLHDHNTNMENNTFTSKNKQYVRRRRDHVLDKNTNDEMNKPYTYTQTHEIKKKQSCNKSLLFEHTNSLFTHCLDVTKDMVQKYEKKTRFINESYGINKIEVPHKEDSGGNPSTTTTPWYLKFLMRDIKIETKMYNIVLLIIIMLVVLSLPEHIRQHMIFTRKCYDVYENPVTSFRRIIKVMHTIFSMGNISSFNIFRSIGRTLFVLLMRVFIILNFKIFFLIMYVKYSLQSEEPVMKLYFVFFINIYNYLILQFSYLFKNFPLREFFLKSAALLYELFNIYIICLLYIFQSFLNYFIRAKRSEVS